MIKCPRDVEPKAFRDMMDVIPKGFVYQKSYIEDGARHFVFLVKRRPRTPQEIPQGETFITSCNLK